MHQRGRIIEVGRNTVKAQLSSLGYTLVATLPTTEVILIGSDAVASEAETPYAGLYQQ